MAIEIKLEDYLDKLDKLEEFTLSFTFCLKFQNRKKENWQTRTMLNVALKLLPENKMSQRQAAEAFNVSKMTNVKARHTSNTLRLRKH